jgi:hypothetical protein
MNLINIILFLLYMFNLAVFSFFSETVEEMITSGVFTIIFLILLLNRAR